MFYIIEFLPLRCIDSLKKADIETYTFKSFSKVGGKL